MIYILKALAFLLIFYCFFSVHPEMNSCSRIEPPIFVKIFHLYPLTFTIDKILIYQRPRFIKFFCFIKAFDRKHFRLITPAGRIRRRSAFGVRRNQQLHNPVIYTFFVCNKRSCLRTSQTIPLGILICLNICQNCILQYCCIQICATDIATCHITPAHTGSPHLSILKINTT